MFSKSKRWKEDATENPKPAQSTFSREAPKAHLFKEDAASRVHCSPEPLRHHSRGCDSACPQCACLGCQGHRTLLLLAFKEQVVFYYLNNCLFAIETLLLRHGSLWMCFSLWASRELHFTLNKGLLRIFSGFFSLIKWIQIIEKIKCSTINISNVSSTAYIYRFSLQKKYFH